MPTTDRTILVTGATGHQGGATARRLLADGWRVRALVRDSASPAARRLGLDGVEVVTGDMGDRDTLDAAADGVYGVFSVQPASHAPHFDEGEARFGINVADAARRAGVRHLVYTSLAGVDRGSDAGPGGPEVAKRQIERHIRDLGLPATVLRPVQFMENHTNRTFGVTGDVALVRMIPPGVTVQLIAVTDIGVFAALAFADPAFYVGKELELAGDEVTREQLIAEIGRATGRVLQIDPLPREILAQLGVDVDALDREKSFNGWRADIPALRRLHPGLMDLGTWLEREGKAMFDALFAETAAN
jgi:uncharacterized protein YbjT (DUF2867 family)